MEQAGRDVKALGHKVSVWPSLYHYMEAFEMLNGSRQTGFGIGYIPLSEIDAYCRIYEIRDLDDIELYVRFIRALDRVWVGHHNAQNKAKEVKSHGQSGNKANPRRRAG